VAVPKRKTSRSNTRHRRSQWKATLPSVAACPRCRQPKLTHVVCPTCGYYHDRQVIAV